MKAFINGKFVSCEENNRFFSVLVEEDGKIVFTGDSLPDKYKDAEKTDLKNRRVTPCFNDTHLHYFLSCVYKCDVRGLTTFDQIISYIQEWEKQDTREIIFGIGLSSVPMKEGALPTKEVLDRATKRPLFLMKWDFHACVVNSAMLDRLPDYVKAKPGINYDTGYIDTEAFQQLMAFATEFALKDTPYIEQQSLNLADTLCRMGINTIHCGEGLDLENLTDINLVESLTQNMPFKVIMWNEILDEVRVKKRGMPRIGACGLAMLDGAYPTEDAYLRRPYNNNPDNYGWKRYDQEFINDWAIRSNRAGLQISSHAIGDGAIDQLITALEAALADTPREDHRHMVLHACMLEPDLLERCAKNNIYCCIQSSFLTVPEDSIEFEEGLLGERFYDFYPLREMLDAGITFGNGSDRPCTISSPIDSIHACCNHINPKHNITVLEALMASTLNAAKFSFDEDNRGSLSVGKVADFVVLDQDIFEIPVENIDKTKVEQVYYGGELYEGIDAYFAKKLHYIK